jgi:MFS family permease
VNVALPTLAQNFNADAGALQWVINAYLLPLSALLLLGGAAGDYFGRRRLLILGTSVFALASLGCSLASGLPALFACRLLQGIGAAMLMPNSLAILGQTFSGASKGRAIGIWAATGAAMGAIGPVIGGWLIDLGSWRAIFLLNLPLAGGAILLAWRIVPPDRRSDAYPLDAMGGILATVGLAALTWALTVGSSRSGWTPTALTAAAAAVLLLLLFLRLETLRGARGAGHDADGSICLEEFRGADAVHVPSLRCNGRTVRAASLHADQGGRLFGDGRRCGSAALAPDAHADLAGGRRARRSNRDAAAA